MSLRPVRRPLRLAAAGLALAMFAAACDGDGSTPASSPGEDSLASFLGWEDDDVDDAAREAEWRDQDAQVQEAIRECMAEAGFEYIPVDYSQGGGYAQEWDEEEYASTHGFGITTWYGNEDEFIEEDVDEFVDPNQEIVEAMSDAEQQAYYEALYGTEEEQREGAVIEYDDETGEEIGWSTFGPGPGCDGEANEAVWGGGGGETQELWEELQPAFDELNARVEADPRIVEWNEEWSRCMADAGHDYESATAMHDQVYEDFQERLNAILGPDGGYVDPFEGWSEADIEAFFEERSEDEIDAFFSEAESGQMDNIDQDALTALQQEEIDLALQDLECRDGDAFWELYSEVSVEYEGDFIAENRELLEQIREAEGD